MIVNTIGSEYLTSKGVQFIIVDVPLIPVGLNTHRMESFVFTSEEELLAEVNKMAPLIIFDLPKHSDNVNSLDNIVEYCIDKDNVDISNSTELFMVRYIKTIKQQDWNIIKSNIFDVKDHNFTFNWNFDNYDCPEYTSYLRRLKHIEEKSKIADEKERDDLMALGKRSPKI